MKLIAAVVKMIEKRRKARELALGCLIEVLLPGNFHDILSDHLFLPRTGNLSILAIIYP